MDRFKFVFFGPKPVNWTTWGALTPILALPGPFRGVFGPRVGFGAPEGSNFPNNEIDPLFVISLFFLHLNSCKRYTFETHGPKWALDGQNWPKMAKIWYSQMAIFWKNITSDLAKNGLKYTSRAILHLVWAGGLVKNCSRQKKYFFWPGPHAHWKKLTHKPGDTREGSQRP